MSIHRDEIKRILYEETQLLDLYGNELEDAIVRQFLTSDFSKASKAGFIFVLLYMQ